MLLRAETIPIEPDPGNAGVGKLTEHLRCSAFFIDLNHRDISVSGKVKKDEKTQRKNLNLYNRNLCLFVSSPRVRGDNWGSGLKNMKKIDKDIGLYFIIDSGFTSDFVQMARLAIDIGLKIIQYRDKNADASEMLENAIKIRKLTEETDTIFIVNDNVDVAFNANADGVHIGQKDARYEDVRKLLPDKIIGVSTENMEQSLLANKIGADYLGVGPIFSTVTKPDAAPPIGVKKLAEIVKATSVPVVAIGGINLKNLESVLEAGVNGVAIISAILAAPNPEEEVKKIISIIKRYRERNPL